MITLALMLAACVGFVALVHWAHVEDRKRVVAACDALLDEMRGRHDDDLAAADKRADDWRQTAADYQRAAAVREAALKDDLHWSRLTIALLQADADLRREVLGAGKVIPIDRAAR